MTHAGADPLLSAPAREIYFDTDRGAWVLSRYADVLAAFRSPFLHLVGPRGRLNRERYEADNEARLRMRSETIEALTPAILHTWQTEISGLAQQILDGLRADRPMDLVHEFAEPVCRRLAALATNISPTEAENLSALSAQVSASAAEPFDQTLAAQSKVAEAQLQPHFQTGPLTLRDSGFVALSQTLPRMLSNIWLALLQQPDQWRRLHEEPALAPRAIEELLRYAGLTRIVFRMAFQSTEINGTPIQAGDRLILRVTSANRDPEHFPDADSLDTSRPSINHFAFGSGRHSCVGAPLIRMMLVTLTTLLVERYPHAALQCDVIDWRGGAGFRFPASLPTILLDTPAH